MQGSKMCSSFCGCPLSLSPVARCNQWLDHGSLSDPLIGFFSATDTEIKLTFVLSFYYNISFLLKIFFSDVFDYLLQLELIIKAFNIKSFALCRRSLAEVMSAHGR